MNNRKRRFLAWIWVASTTLLAGCAYGHGDSTVIRCMSCSEGAGEQCDSWALKDYMYDHCVMNHDLCFWAVVSVTQPTGVLYKGGTEIGIRGCAHRAQKIWGSLPGDEALIGPHKYDTVHCKTTTVVGPYGNGLSFNGTFCFCHADKCNLTPYKEMQRPLIVVPDETATGQGSGDEDTTIEPPPTTTSKATTKVPKKSTRKTATTTRVPDDGDDEESAARAAAEMERRRVAEENGPSNPDRVSPDVDKWAYGASGSSSGSGPSGGVVAVVVIVVLVLLVVAGAVGYLVYTGKWEEIIKDTKDKLGWS